MKPKMWLFPGTIAGWHTQRLEQRRAERDVPIAITFAALDVNQH
jgi:hypothetical protein